jgi:ribokinase
LNLDHVYRVQAIARPGETVPSTDYRLFAGGKGANQSMALARAGVAVAHAGKIGPEGAWLRQKLAEAGVDTRFIRVAQEPGGHAIIQVDAQGQNSIVLYGGTNQAITEAEVRETLAAFAPGDYLLLQNETNVTAALIEAGHAAGMVVILNPAPMTEAVHGSALAKLGFLVVNETEGAALAGVAEPPAILAELCRRLPRTGVVLTLGADGVLYGRGAERLQLPAYKVEAVDSTAAGDTFIGYWLAGLVEGLPTAGALDLGCRAAALSVTKPGAMDSIPRREEVDRFGR